MNEKKQIKGDIKYLVQLNEEQKNTKSIIIRSPVTIITGRAGSGKSLVCAQTALDLIFKKVYKKINVTRSLVEVGETMGLLPGNANDKFNPYMEPIKENLYNCYDRLKIDSLIQEGVIQAFPVQFARGKTVDEILIIEEAQNLTQYQMLAVLTRLGKFGKIIINGDAAQRDIGANMGETGLDYCIRLSKAIPEIIHIKLKENHRNDLVGKILDFEYGN